MNKHRPCDRTEIRDQKHDALIEYVLIGETERIVGTNVFQHLYAVGESGCSGVFQLVARCSLNIFEDCKCPVLNETVEVHQLINELNVASKYGDDCVETLVHLRELTDARNVVQRLRLSIQ